METKTITLTEKQLQKFKKVLASVHNGCAQSLSGEPAECCEWYTTDEIKEIAEALGVYDENLYEEVDEDSIPYFMEMCDDED